MDTITIKEFYNDIFNGCCPELEKFIDDNDKDIGHFNVFNIAELHKTCNSTKPTMPYNRRSYYKISLIKGKNRVEYADRVIDINSYAVLFATPRIPYNYTPMGGDQSGHFCVFTPQFLTKLNSGMIAEDIPIFQAGSDFVYRIPASQFKEFELIFNKMHAEIASDYIYKYDLLRNYVIELIHFGQKLQPLAATGSLINAATRISTLFIELLERQFPIEPLTQVLQLKTAKDYADMLKVHINHLNKVLKDRTGKTTTEIISSRITQEAKMLLQQTAWNISEIAYALGFEEVAHFSNFFKKQTSASPLAYRDQLFELHK